MSKEKEIQLIKPKHWFSGGHFLALVCSLELKPLIIKEWKSFELEDITDQGPNGMLISCLEIQSQCRQYKFSLHNLP